MNKDRKYQINAVDPSGSVWQVVTLNDPHQVSEVIDGLRNDEDSNRPNRIYWVTLTNDPEKGDIEDSMYDL